MSNQHHLGLNLIVYLVMFIGIFVYYLPSWIALNRNRKRFLWLFGLNCALGWTGLGWLIALYWAFYEEAEEN
jgi:type IV secretory pathway TrbL component